MAQHWTVLISAWFKITPICVFCACSTLASCYRLRHTLMRVYTVKTLVISILYCRQQLLLLTWVHYLQATEQTCVLCCCFASQNDYYCKAKEEYKNQARQLRGRQENVYLHLQLFPFIMFSPFLFCFVDFEGNWQPCFLMRNTLIGTLHVLGH